MNRMCCFRALFEGLGQSNLRSLIWLKWGGPATQPFDACHCCSRELNYLIAYLLSLFHDFVENWVRLESDQATCYLAYFFEFSKFFEWSLPCPLALKSQSFHKEHPKAATVSWKTTNLNEISSIFHLSFCFWAGYSSIPPVSCRIQNFYQISLFAL